MTTDMRNIQITRVKLMYKNTHLRTCGQQQLWVGFHLFCFLENLGHRIPPPPGLTGILFRFYSRESTQFHEIIT